MKTATFIEGVVMAFLMSLAASVIFVAFTSLFSGGFVLRAVVTFIALVYLLYLLRRSRERLGRITVLAGWSIAAIAIWTLAPNLTVHVLLHVGLIWLVRSLYFYSSVLSALLDLGLCVLSLAATLWALSQTHSVFLSVWCFFLVQSLFVAIPACIRRERTSAHPGSGDDEGFDHAHRAAQSALNKLSASI